MGLSLYWIGTEESDIIYTGNMFKGSITVYGTNANGNFAFDKMVGYRIDYNTHDKQWIEFVNDSCKSILLTDPHCRFVLYYTPELAHLDEFVKTRVLSNNDSEIVSLLENKIRTKQWLADHVIIPPFYVLDGELIDIEYLNDKFPNVTEFVIQADFSSSGSGTWLFNGETKSEVLPRIKKTNSYTVSPYLKNSIPINIHLIIYQNDVILLPPSIQIISMESNCFSYKGADFLAYKQLPIDIKNLVEKYALLIGKKLSYIGYKGVCGIDFIATHDNVYFMEINPRFQGSTKYINRAFYELGYNKSVHHMHLDAFRNKECQLFLPNMTVNLSFYRYSYDKRNIQRLMFIHNSANNADEVILCIDDGLDWNMEFHDNSNLFELMFNHNIVAIGPEHKCIINVNVENKLKITKIKNWKNEAFMLKILLLKHGLRINKIAKEKLQATGGFNHKEFNAVDITINDLHISVPYGVKMSELSPFEIKLDNNNEYMLLFLESMIANISIRKEDPMGSDITKNGLNFNQISYLGHDRLRIFHRNSCFYKTNGLGCEFCDINICEQQFSIEDIKYVIDRYANHKSIRHYLIGGGSNESNDDFKRIIEIAKYIKQKTNKSIYLMTTPPKNTGVLNVLSESGITEVTFNLEIYDREIAKKHMPGKGVIPLSLYENAFKDSVNIWGRYGNVRTIFIVGLEPKKSLLKGVEFACRLGVSPILSLFYPIKNTPLEYMISPPADEVLEICMEAETICRNYGLMLGPSCKYCEDNVLKISI